MKQPASSTQPKPSTAIKALIDVIERLPLEMYGTGHARFLRRLVHIVLAKYADADGTKIYASLDRIAYLSLTTEKSARGAIKYLESVGLVRKLDEPHPIYGTNQYELLFPSSEALELAAKKRVSVLHEKREQTRKRVASWRAKQAETRETGESVTVAPSVTVSPVTEVLGVSVTVENEFCNGSKTIGNGSPKRSVTVVATTVDRPALPSFLDRPLQPSNQPSAKSDGWSEGGSPVSSESTPRASEYQDFDDAWGQWMSDMFFEKAGARHVPCAVDISRLNSILSDKDPAMLAAATYLFCLRPKGLGGLTDAFGAFWRECSNHLKDSQERLDNTDMYGPAREILQDLHAEVFPLESIAREHGKTSPSMTCFDTVCELLQLSCPMARATEKHIEETLPA